MVSVSSDETIRVEVRIDPNTTENNVLHDERLHPPDLFPNGRFEITNDGWMFNTKGEMLLWNPHERGTGLRQPQFRILNNQPISELNSEHFVHSEEWTQCYRGSVDGQGMAFDAEARLDGRRE